MLQLTEMMTAPTFRCEIDPFLDCEFEAYVYKSSRDIYTHMCVYERRVERERERGVADKR